MRVIAHIHAMTLIIFWPYSGKLMWFISCLWEESNSILLHKAQQDLYHL